MIDGVHFFFDEGPGIGLGHRRRCEAVAVALEALGVPTSMAPVGTPRGPSTESSALVIDSYRTRADDGNRYATGPRIAFDDLDRDLAVDLVIVTSPGADARRHRAARRVLAGARYAVVDPKVHSATPKAVSDVAATVLVTMGAADSGGIGARVAADLRSLTDRFEIRLVVGPWGDHFVPDRVDGIVAPDGLVGELAAADVVVTAGGVTMLEALAIGRPCVVVTTADNQRTQVGGVIDADAAWTASVDTAGGRARSLLEDASERRRLSAAATRLIDGGGADRIANAIVGLLLQPEASMGTEVPSW